MKNLLKTVAMVLVFTMGFVACDKEEIEPNDKSNKPNIELTNAQADGTGDGEDEGDPIIQETP